MVTEVSATGRSVENGGTGRKQFADWPVPGLKEVKAITPEGDIVQIDLPPYRPMEEHPWLPSTS